MYTWVFIARWGDTLRVSEEVIWIYFILIFVHIIPEALMLHHLTHCLIDIMAGELSLKEGRLRGGHTLIFLLMEKGIVLEKIGLFDSFLHL